MSASVHEQRVRRGEYTLIELNVPLARVDWVKKCIDYNAEGVENSEEDS